MAKVPEMSANFARWYAEAFMDESSKRDLRWKGVVDATTKADHKTAEVLTRLAFQSPVPACGRKSENLSDTFEKLVATISGGDATFDPSHSARELQVLAAAALERLFNTLPDAALTVVTASFGRTRQPDLPMDLVNLAERALVALTSRKHARVDFDDLKLPAPKVNYNIAADSLQSADPTEIKEQFELLRNATDSTIQRVVSGFNSVVNQLHNQISLDEEELQMLWWLLGEYSRLLDKPFSKINELEKPLVLAYELGQMTAISPGPTSIRAILLRAKVGTKKLKLEEAVNATSLEWANSASSSTLVSPATTPIHFALEQRTELGSKDSWQAGWSSLTGLTADTLLPAIELSELFYREHVFLNVSA
ncbi:GTPase-associated system all-helical protein GASH [Roseibium album]|uniref:GTPase-associated system all-helical protein GASH n=1 Tax=Roseibium album TaxID=311410 RepID=UPI00391A3AE5